MTPASDQATPPPPAEENRPSASEQDSEPAVDAMEGLTPEAKAGMEFGLGIINR